MPLSTLGVAHRRVPGMRHENTMSTDFPALPTFHGSLPMIDPEDVALLLVGYQLPAESHQKAQEVERTGEPLDSERD